MIETTSAGEGRRWRSFMEGSFQVGGAMSTRLRDRTCPKQTLLPLELATPAGYSGRPVTTEPETLRDVLLARAEADPDRLAYDDELRRITFGELAEAAALRAGALAEVGGSAGDRVAPVLPAGIPFAAAFWGLPGPGAA